MNDQPTWKVGDIANGYILSNDGWHPLPVQPYPGPPAHPQQGANAPYRGPTPQRSVGLGVAILAGPLVIALVGLALSLTSASLLTGTGSQWTGFAIAAIASVGAIIAAALLWKKIPIGLAVSAIVSTALVAALSFCAVVYLEVQLNERRQEISDVFD